MEKNKVLAMTALQKATTHPLTKIHLCSVYQLTDLWQKQEILNAGLAAEASSVEAFEKLIDSPDTTNIIVSPFLVNRVLLEKIINRHAAEKNIFLDLA